MRQFLYLKLGGPFTPILPKNVLERTPHSQKENESPDLFKTPRHHGHNGTPITPATTPLTLMILPPMPTPKRKDVTPRKSPLKRLDTKQTPQKINSSQRSKLSSRRSLQQQFSLSTGAKVCVQSVFNCTVYISELVMIIY